MQLAWPLADGRCRHGTEPAGSGRSFTGFPLIGRGQAALPSLGEPIEGSANVEAAVSALPTLLLPVSTRGQYVLLQLLYVKQKTKKKHSS